MNRIGVGVVGVGCGVPHRRGDEPVGRNILANICLVFPTGVGMNRRHVRQWLVGQRVPHRRGDEPLTSATGIQTIKRVPHRRGDEPRENSRDMKKATCSPQAWG